jgi:hypothetical protein
MFSGDSLAVITLLAGTVISAIFGAIPLDRGRKRNILWACAAFFAVLLVGWIAAPAAIPAVQVARSIVAAVVQSGAFVMVVTVAIVALMIGRQPKAAPAPVEPSPPSAPNTGEHQRVIRALRGAKDSAAIAIRTSTDTNRVREAEREMPQIRAALLSANKLYGLPMPTEGGGAVIALELHRRYIEKVLPYLQQGHIEEALRQAEAYLARFNSPQEKAAP